MAQSTFFLTWESHKTNISNGLSNLQQNGEFVDMTLAADGHMVKVHQMVMALASPYIKELLTSIDSRHPVVFLNKVSYTTLSALLEYIYTGEVVVSVENLHDLIQAAKELHIRGLEDMKLQNTVKERKPATNVQVEEESIKQTDGSNDEICYFQIGENNEMESQKSYSYDNRSDDIPMEADGEVTIQTEEGPDMKTIKIDDDDKSEINTSNTCVRDQGPLATIQFTVSNQGSLQMILNRFIYYMKHCNRNNSRQWRCVDYLNARKCPAIVVTKDDVVVQRISAHNHPFHDKRILKKVNEGAVYSAIQEAVDFGNRTRKAKKSDYTSDSNMKEETELIYE